MLAVVMSRCHVWRDVRLVIANVSLSNQQRRVSGVVAAAVSSSVTSSPAASSAGLSQTASGAGPPREYPSCG